VDRDKVKELGVPRMQSAKIAEKKHVQNGVTVREENIKTKLNK
jgi:hypothetical protein